MADRLANSLSRARFIVPSTGRIGQYRIVAVGCIAALLFGAWQIAATWGYWQHLDLFAGVDYRILTQAAHRWFDGQGFYHAYQLAGPYDIKAMDYHEMSPIMYPPTVLLLLVPFALAPSFLAVLWWAIPLSILGWVVYQHHPRPLLWPVLLLLAVFPTTVNTLATGNPTLWFTAGLALGTRGGWAVLLLLKPTIAPLALVGVWRRSWWIGLAGLSLASLLFLPMWFDYLRVLGNTQNQLGFLYSFNQLPMLMIPIIAWLGRIHAADAGAPDRRAGHGPVQPAGLESS